MQPGLGPPSPALGDSPREGRGGGGSAAAPVGPGLAALLLVALLPEGGLAQLPLSALLLQPLPLLLCPPLLLQPAVLLLFLRGEAQAAAPSASALPAAWTRPGSPHGPRSSVGSTATLAAWPCSLTPLTPSSTICEWVLPGTSHLLAYCRKNRDTESKPLPPVCCIQDQTKCQLSSSCPGRHLPLPWPRSCLCQPF